MPPPDDAGPSLPYRQASKLLTHFATFLTLALHTLLYHRSLYPEPTFLTARAYNLPVRQSRHPGVCRWVTDAVAAVVAQLRTAAVERVVFSVHEKSVAVPAAPAAAPAPTSAFAVKGGAPKKDAAKREKGAQKTFAVLERWIFDVSSFPSWPGEEDDPTKETGYDSDENEDGDRDEHELGDEEEEDEGEENLIDEDEVDEDAIIWNDVNESLRGALGRLAAAAEGMPPLPEGCPFTLAIELRGEAKPPIEHPQAWIPSQPPLQQFKSKQRQQPPKRTSTTPVRAIQAGPLFFECWVEQSHAAKKTGPETLQLSRNSRGTKAAPS